MYIETALCSTMSELLTAEKSHDTELLKKQFGNVLWQNPSLLNEP